MSLEDFPLRLFHASCFVPEWDTFPAFQHGQKSVQKSSAYDWLFLCDVPWNGGGTMPPCDSLQSSSLPALLSEVSFFIDREEVNCHSMWNVGGLKARTSLGSHCFSKTKFVLLISMMRLRNAEKMLCAFKIWKWKRFVVYWIFVLQNWSFLEKFHLCISLLKELIVPAGTEISCILHVCI